MPSSVTQTKGPKIMQSSYMSAAGGNCLYKCEQNLIECLWVISSNFECDRQSIYHNEIDMILYYTLQAWVCSLRSQDPFL